MNMNKKNKKLVKPGSNIVRVSRLESIKPINIKLNNFNFTKRLYNPSLALFGSYILIIIIGTILLMSPFAANTQENNGILTSLFTATSAFTLTGLIVQNTNQFWTTFGQIIIITLIFIGGIGFMTSTIFILKIFGQKISLPQQILLRESLADTRSLGRLQLGNLIPTISIIISYSIIIQISVGVLLFLVFYSGINAKEAIWLAISHTISSFNGAGFLFFKTEGLLGGYEKNISILTLMGINIFFGSLGYLIFIDLFQNLRWKKLSLNSKLVISSTIFLNLLGMLILFGVESQPKGVLENTGIINGSGQSLFNTVSGRTAGFSSIDFNSIRIPTALWCSALMFIGGASASTAGGIKLNTIMVVYSFILSTLKGSKDTSIFNRKIPTEQVNRCITILMISLMIIFIATILISLNDSYDIHKIFFEICSAFGTVGLSSGFTQQSSDLSKLILIILMIIGRIGPLTMVLALGNRNNPIMYKNAEERVTIG